MARRKRTSVGENFLNRKSGRSDLRSERVGNEEIFRGSLADQALQAVNARAGTIDGEIIVNSQFNATTPEGQALLTHEMYHKENSGGVAGHSIRDAEEMAARALEAMVFQEAESTGKNVVPKSATELLEQAKEMQDKRDVGEPYNPEDPNASFEPSAVRGFQALMAEGYTYEQLLQECVHRLISHHETASSSLEDRSGNVRGFLS